MLNPILASSATRRMRSPRTAALISGYGAALLLLSALLMKDFFAPRITLSQMGQGVTSFLFLTAAQAALLPLVGQIPGLTRMEVKPCFCGPDFVLYSEFDSREALNGYADHPLHVEAKSHFFPWVASRMPADYEV